ncbi:PKD domain-containing protein [bacterium]|nr:PKD domain-containing protein [bacterium]
MKLRELNIVLGVCLLLIAGCGDDNNDGGTGGNTQPVISSFTPNQVNRGQQNVEGHINGTNLNGVTSVTLGDGLTVVRFIGVSATDIQVIFNVGNNAAAGGRTISVSTSAGSTSSSTVLTVSDNRIPQAKFTISPAQGAENTLFTVDATNSNDADGKVDKYAWDFGDGKIATGRTATHKYSTKGTYKITLTVTDNDGATASSSKDVQVEKGQAPVASFVITPPAGQVGLAFRYDASASTDKDGKITKFEWKFGDGGSATGPIVTHIYNNSGIFDVTLSVTDDTGLKSEKENQLRVEKFDEQKAKNDIDRLMRRFFERFSKLERFDAETIVDGWSTAPECKGRDHEIRIIERQQQLIKETDAEVRSVEVLVKPSRVDANATVVAKFQWTTKAGVDGSSTVVHHFTLIFDDGEWQICNFSLENLSAAGNELFLLD